ncbi:2-hydroxyacid dehydrogenase [Zeaxanthinibacter enoshimensis]|uniref:Glyoxylate/hydroxypyruvate reductase A n=1 Tax=Zeaxanthinibacter enoshimensis TaxID=392009 RepID=A0A4R6TLM3_9FLAO|nr:glyoxylate/hydroxypyruvate reductase A [Zeaxanthinibacter enoshimensis]TDQ31412.1 glyoxylate/hydroxypyruvate reductase A [Zeaxanthinibacter enoshimensis]
MAIVIIRQDGKSEEWRESLHKAAPGINIYVHGNEFPKEEVIMALVWKHPVGSLKNYPRLQLVNSMGAGVDFILDDPDLPPQVAVCRVVDPLLAEDMSEFVLSLVLGHIKNLNTYHGDHRRRWWQPLPYRRIKETKVGIMGLGALGATVAHDLKDLGFAVSGWSRTKKDLPGITTYEGPGGFQEFLGGVSVLVCLLPLTPETQGILNTELFYALPQGTYLINVARGGHLQEEDLLQAIDNGQISGASLDVFEREPLPVNHAFWDNENILITPHVASVTDVDSVASLLLENYRRLKAGQALRFEVSLSRGY